MLSQCRTVQVSKSTFMRGNAPVVSAQRKLAVRVSRSQVMTSKAYLREYPDPEFIEEVKENFPEQPIANVEEARVLFSELGYKYLDVRPELELDAVGKVRDSINVPIVNAKWRYDPEEQKKVVDKSDNPDFVKMVEKRIPDKSTPIMVGCSDGTTYSIDALIALEEAGYETLVGLKGGFYAWYRVFDNNLRRRRTGEYAEQYTHDGDSCGIHSSGAGFARVDSVEQWVPPKF
ncbi:hypothetical protein M9434_002067 [Picochlorum sp. BPE23]|nr:hypothetical protein M9434_002067 [Picochlorum sp. BPE23]